MRIAEFTFCTYHGVRGISTIKYLGEDGKEVETLKDQFGYRDVKIKKIYEKR